MNKSHTHQWERIALVWRSHPQVCIGMVMPDNYGLWKQLIVAGQMQPIFDVCQF